MSHWGRRVAPAFERLDGLPQVTLYRGPLSVPDYYGLMAGSVVLLPHWASRYVGRSSGVYLEARCLGAPVIASPGSWMAKDIAVSGNGIVSEALTADAFARAIARAAPEVDPLRARAGIVARDFRRRHGVRAFLDSVGRLTS